MDSTPGSGTEDSRLGDDDLGRGKSEEHKGTTPWTAHLRKVVYGAFLVMNLYLFYLLFSIMM